MKKIFVLISLIIIFPSYTLSMEACKGSPLKQDAGFWGKRSVPRSWDNCIGWYTYIADGVSWQYRGTYKERLHYGEGVYYRENISKTTISYHQNSHYNENERQGFMTVETLSGKWKGAKHYGFSNNFKFEGEVTGEYAGNTWRAVYKNGVLTENIDLLFKNGDHFIPDSPTSLNGMLLKTNGERVYGNLTELVFTKILTEEEILEDKKNKCRDYGFKDSTDGMGLCLIELDKLDVLKKQDEQLLQQQKARNVEIEKQNAVIAKQQADAKRQREAQALINLGNMIGNLGTNTNSVPIDTNSSPEYLEYPYTFTRNVASNQNCPIISATRLVKQERKGTNKICYYQ